MTQSASQYQANISAARFLVRRKDTERGLHDFISAIVLEDIIFIRDDVLKTQAIESTVSS
jgi:hypothetical protein